MHTPNLSPTINQEPLALNTIADDLHRPPSYSNSKILSSPSTMMYSSSYVDDDGDIGSKDEDDDDEEDNACWGSYGRRSPEHRFPPPIPLLVRTANLACHMPWVLKRTYKEDGSLVIKEVKVKHHEYFRARRENGRLTLQLVHMEDCPQGLRCREEDEAEKEMSPMVHNEMENQTLSLSSSSSSSSLSSFSEGDGSTDEEFSSIAPRSSCFLGGEKYTDKEVKSTDSKTQPYEVQCTVEKKKVDVTNMSPGFATSSLTVLSSSMPEPISEGIRKGCFTNGGLISSPLNQIPVTRMRTAVRS